jgi:hypothetical protein
MLIDTTFNFYTDSNGKDPDSASPTLRAYHKFLWSKPLPNGTCFVLTDNKSGSYLYHKSLFGEYFLGSDAITHSYKNHQLKSWLTHQIQEEVEELFHAGSTIGAYTLFPNNRLDGEHTINQARGINSFIDDRFDLTLECVRLFYLGLESPLYDTFNRYKNFFDLFENFAGYINFFSLDDLVDRNGRIKFYLPFDNFQTKPSFSNIDEYLVYKKGVMKFIEARNLRIETWTNEQNASR